MTLVRYPNSYAEGERAAEKALTELDHLLEGPVPPQEMAAFSLSQFNLTAECWFRQPASLKKSSDDAASTVSCSSATK
ncbi:hypothetical protein [Bradyrhizobium nanningense]|uniref:hypothetical protein n=1 Tax=Bradyrhizobium nanningense TaxID=1325118 RepID=UPI001FDF6CFA|nr:hypothetical protein [Bradyrhizobium nanningense]